MISLGGMTTKNPLTLESLNRIVRRLSYREGDFTLASGQKSSFYVNLKNSTLHPEGAAIIGELAVDALVKHGQPVEGVGGLTLGADPIATSVSLAAFRRGLIWPAYIVRKEVKGHGTAQSVEGGENLKPGAKIVVLEDVVTSGGSSIIAIQRLREAGFNPTCVLTIVDREQGGRAAIEKEGLQFLALTTLGAIQKAGL